ncbi:ELWxxDGT repeat protein [Emticicia agri]|uniref:Hyalin n=1 Tax=Emticicia agri TaxID=2492393 RepID=A0A4Q5M0E9_9BACT|nr:ELWxxDGT repeat protein [Emticicia agri]RYU95746.1 hypothetical protein EWM59_10305 [Emticicia agri]
MKQLYVILFTVISFVSPAQKLLKDIVTSNASSHPRAMVNANGKYFFIAKGAQSNSELFVTDGTNAGTVQLTNSSSNSGPYLDGALFSFGDKILFSAYYYLNNNYQGSELWISDGTVAGTKLLKEINTNSNSSSYPGSFIKLGSKAIFWANDGVNGTEPWVTDGTPEGTFLLNDLNPGSSSSFVNNPADVVILNSKLYFSSYSPNNGYELYVSDGNPWGTYMIKDIYPGSNSSSPGYFTLLGNKFYFSANDGTNGTELWVSDGTDYGTTVFKDIYSGPNSSYISNIMELNGKLIFRADNGGTGYELFVSNGTNAGTTLLKDIYPGYASSSPQDFIKSGNNIFFSATDGVNGRELWKTNGTIAGTSLVKDINLTSSLDESYTFSSNSTRRKFVDANGKLFFIANNGPDGFELWKSDGTTAGTSMVKEFVPGPVSSELYNLQAFGSNLYFSATDNAGKYVYYKTDGTNAGTVSVSDMNPGLPVESVFPLLNLSNTYLYFAAYNKEVGYELFRTNGTTISLIKDIEPNFYSNSADFSTKIGLGDNLLFTYNDNLHGLELWKTDGASNTGIIKEMTKYPTIGSSYYSNSSSISSLVTFKNYSYFLSNGSIWRTNGQNMEIFAGSSSYIYSMILSNNKIRWVTTNQLYESDGDDIKLIASLNDYNYYSSYLAADINGITYFLYSTYSNGTELWRTDGTAGGTWMVRDINYGSSPTSFGIFKKVGNKLFFTVYSDVNFGTELWVTDGTEGGTYLVKDINPGFNSSSPYNLTNLNDNLLIFSAYNNSYGSELWRSDGTEAGTYMVADINSGSSGSYPSSYEMGEFAILNNKVYFEAYGNFGFRLYWTDGNTVSMFNRAIDPEAMIKFNNQLYFRGVDYNDPQGYELWKSDGTVAGTSMVKDIFKGTSSSYPSKFFAFNDVLYFTANDGIHGIELWSLTPCADSLYINSALTGTEKYQASKIIVGAEANTIDGTANITYDAANYVLLQPGFSTNDGAVFQTLLEGCGNNAPLTGNADNTTTQKTDNRTEEYIQDMQDAPSIDDFITKGNNSDLRQIWAKYLEDSRVLIDKEQQLKNELKILNEQKSEVKTNKNQEALVNHYNASNSKEQAYEIARQEAGKYNYFINPVRNQQGEKLGYDLTIYAAGKKYESAIRY